MSCLSLTCIRKSNTGLPSLLTKDPPSRSLDDIRQLIWEIVPKEKLEGEKWTVTSAPFCTVPSTGCFSPWQSCRERIYVTRMRFLVFFAELRCLNLEVFLPLRNTDPIRSSSCSATNHYTSRFCSYKIWMMT